MKLILVVLATALAFSATASELSVSAYSFEAHGQVIGAERGEFRVPENRANPTSRQIRLSFVRFPSSNPAKGPPIVYLAGGPGGSGVATARGSRFPIFMALREVADVIAFDQRGTGWSNDIPECQTRHAYPVDRPMTTGGATELLHQAASECEKFWKKAGVDITGYTTTENAADLEDLRLALGASKISLWGISYGSHLALATIKRYPDSIERVVLAGLEGLDETVKMPVLTDAFFARVQAAIDADPKAAKAYPDLAGMMRRVHARLEQAPVTVAVKDKEGKPASIVVGKFHVQLLIAGSISDPQNTAKVPAMYARMDTGDFSQVGQVLYPIEHENPGISFRGMPEAMDVASGLSAERARLVQAQARNSLLGDALNFPMPQLVGAFGGLDLGEQFRSPVRTAIPTLFFSGTLDGRTYPESVAEIAAGFSNATRVIVENGGHNLFEADPEIRKMIVAFLGGKPVTITTLKLPAPKFDLPAAR